MKKGAKYEKDILEKYLLPLWPAAARRFHAKGPGNTDLGDFDGVDGWIIDAKKRETWDLPGWIRKIRVKGERWFLIFGKDGRTLPGDFVLLPAECFFDLLHTSKAADMSPPGEDREGADGRPSE